jgi:long-chain fatty acid adenylase/transferase FadD26
MQLLAKSGLSYSCAPNFAFDLAARRTSDDDMAGLDLGDVLAISNGAERVRPATIKRFNERFARFNLKDTAIRPSYGLAEATLWVATPRMGHRVKTVRFDLEHLSVGDATRCAKADEGGTDLVSYGAPRMSTVRIVDPETKRENPPGTIGEIWVHGDNVARGYWQKPVETDRTFDARIVAPSAGTPATSWLRTGDLGVIFEGELFILGRLKDVLMVDGRNHYPDDIEATVQEITGGRVAAISVPGDSTERLVVIVELDERDRSDADYRLKLRGVKREMISAISNLHGLRVADVVLVAPGSIPITTSGKVRRSTCAERYRNDEFKRLDVSTALLAETW